MKCGINGIKVFRCKGHGIKVAIRLERPLFSCPLVTLYLLCVLTSWPLCPAACSVTQVSLGSPHCWLWLRSKSSSRALLSMSQIGRSQSWRRGQRWIVHYKLTRCWEVQHSAKEKSELRICACWLGCCHEMTEFICSLKIVYCDEAQPSRRHYDVPWSHFMHQHVFIHTDFVLECSPCFSIIAWPCLCFCVIYLVSLHLQTKFMFIKKWTLWCQSVFPLK